MIDLDLLMSPEAVHRLKSAGLHKVAAALHRVDTGEDIGEEMTLEKAAELIARKAFLKRASHQKITAGLASYRLLRK